MSQVDPSAEKGAALTSDTKNPLEFVLRVEQFVEQAQGQQSSQALVLSNVARDGQAIDVDVTQAQVTLARLVEADAEALSLRANSYVRVTVSAVTREEAEASFNRPQAQSQQQSPSAPLTPNTAQATQAPVRAVEPQQSSVVSAAPAQQQQQ